MKQEQKDTLTIIFYGTITGTVWIIPGLVFDFPTVITAALSGITAYVTGRVLAARIERRYLNNK